MTILRALFVLAVATTLAVADQVIYSHHQLLSGWSDASTDQTKASYIGETIAIHSIPYAIFAVKNPSVSLGQFSGVRFDIRVCCPDTFRSFLTLTNTIRLHI